MDKTRGSHSTKAVGDAFEREVRTVLEYLGYVVTPQEILSANRNDFLAIAQSETGSVTRVLIECKWKSDGRVGAGDFNIFCREVYNARQSGAADSGMLVSNVDFSHQARDAAKLAAPLIQLLKIDELRARVYNPDLYLLSAQPLWLGACEGFVPTGAAMVQENGYGNVPDLASYLASAFSKSPHRFVTLLGGIGMGKSLHVAKLADYLATQYHDHRGNITPLVIPMERFRGFQNAPFEDFLIHYLRNHFRYERLSWKDLAHCLENGRVALFLDGFDEIPNLKSVEHAQIEFAQIISALPAGAPTLVATRASVFGHSTRQVAQLIREHCSKRYGDSVVSIELRPFSPGAIRIFAENAGVNVNLASLPSFMARPMLLKLYLDRGNIDQVPQSEGELVASSIDTLLEYKRHHMDLDVSLATWRTLLENIALEAVRLNTRWVERDVIASAIQAYPSISALGADKAIVELQVRTLVEANTGGLTFLHQIFRDCLAAQAIARRLIRPTATDRQFDGISLSEYLMDQIQYESRRLGLEAERLRQFQRPHAPNLQAANSLDWCWIPPGLGIVSDQNRNDRGGLLRFFPSGFWMSKTVVSARHYMEAAKSSGQFLVGIRTLSDYPLVNITNEQAEAICRRLFNGRLPTEEEWERACLWADGAHTIAETERMHLTKCPIVGESAANLWGVQDSLGVVWQWTSSRDEAGRPNVVKGHWWGKTFQKLQNTSARLSAVPFEPHHRNTGFRVAIDSKARL
jgi:hypothetical protein